MFETHFGLHAPPFQLVPDPAFLFGSRGHRQALAYLKYGVSQQEGFIVVTGEVGAGKTTTVRALMQSLDPTRIIAAQVVNTQVGRCRAAVVDLRVVRHPPAERIQGPADLHSGGVSPGHRHARQACAADRRRGAEPRPTRTGRAAHAVELPDRQPGAAAELPGGPARIACHARLARHGPVPAARDRIVPPGQPVGRGDRRLRRAPPEARGPCRPAHLRCGGPGRDPCGHRRRAPAHQRAVQPLAAVRLPGVPR